MSALAPGSSGASVTSRTGPASSRRSSSSGSGSRRALGRMDPEARGREERPFEVRAEDAGPVRLGRHLAEGGEELLLGGGDERRQVGGDAGLEQRLAGAGGSRRRRRRGSRRPRSRSPGGRRSRATAIPRPFGEREAERGDPTVRRSRRRPGRAGRRRARLRRRASLRLHRAARCCRRARRAAARAASASMPARSETIATLRVAVRRRERVVDLLGRRAGRGARRCAATRARSFSFVGDDVDHEVPVRLPEADHRDRRDRVEDELLRRTGLEPRRAGEELRTDDDDDLVVDERAELGARDARRRTP